jgi:hypothetical protein
MAHRSHFGLLLSVALGAACPGAQAQGNPHDEAARLIGALELSNAQRNAARDLIVLEMARGGTPRAAPQRWVQMQEARRVRHPVQTRCGRGVHRTLAALRRRRAAREAG